VIIELPYPPTANTYWRNVGGRVLLSKKGRLYRKAVQALAWAHKWPQYGNQRVSVLITATMPDRRRRDIDNLHKACLDSLTHAGVWDDDSQIDDLHIVRDGVEKPGKLMIDIQVL